MSEIYTSIEDVLPVLRSRLLDYLTLKLGISNPKKHFKCLWHEDEGRPNMVLNPKSGCETAHCFNCGTTADIFTFAAKIDSLPTSGSDWINVTIPKLCDTLKIQYNFGEPSQAQRDKAKLTKFCRDISDIISTNGDTSYAKQRGWDTDKIIMGSIDIDDLMSKLVHIGWNIDYILSSGLLRTKEKIFFGSDKFTFVIEDAYKRSIGFISRNLDVSAEEKYIHSFDTILFRKSKCLFGTGIDLQKSKQHGIYIVEGTGDVAALVSNGITNCSAVLGTAITEEHLLELKKLGIRKVILCLDWDGAGEKATKRAIEQILPKVQDISYFIKLPACKDSDYKDPDEYLKHNSPEDFLALSEVSVFEWQLSQLTGLDPEEICNKILPIIASENSAIRRNLMIQQLSKLTGVALEAIESDLSILRDHDLQERRGALVAAAQEFQVSLEREPDNYITLVSQLEESVSKIEKRYAKAVVGNSYQLQRYEDIQKLKELNSKGNDYTAFRFNFFKDFAEALAGGMPYTRGCLIYAGGRSNCFAIDTEIIDPCTGKITTPSNLTYVNSVNEETGEIEIKKVLDFIKSGQKECFKVKNQYGDEIVASPDHRFLTKEGWKTLKEINANDYIAIPRYISYKNEQNYTPISKKEALFLGLMLGDGNFTQPRPTFIASDTVLISILESLVTDIFGSNIQVVQYAERFVNESCYTVGITQKDWKTNRDKGGRCIPNPVTTFFKQKGLYGKKHLEKFIPEDIFISNLDIVAALLNGLFTTDGSIYVTTEKNTKRVAIEFSSVSKQLSKQIHHLLRRFGIVSTLRKKKKNKNNETWLDAYVVSIREKESMLIFLDKIGFSGSKQAVADYVKDLITEYKKKKNNLRFGNIIWGKITSVESVGIRETCDIEVDLNHNFCTDGFVLHNSGKTLSCIAYGCDVALSDPDAMVIIHSIDDSYEQIEPRIKTNLYNMFYQDEEVLSLDMAVSPWKYNTPEIRKIITKADDLYKQLLLEERLVVLDGNDGMNLTSLERQWRFYRTRYPSRKLLGICDNTHDYEDFSHLDKTSRMTLISSAQKKMATKYNACLLATAEYRKSDKSYSERIVWPTNDDLADARALSYRPNIIFHVYNDLADRGEKAEIFWIDPQTGERRPRLVHLFTKNKINSFKGKLIRDVDPLTVSCKPKLLSDAKREWADPQLPAHIKKVQEEFDESLGFSIETDYEEE